ncbi:MAG: NAD(P)H-hydrate dehydratase [Anaerolineae bacterium]|nr:NAD(P)H-hydrate dehydratase [Anaerolineae bacterium]
MKIVTVDEMRQIEAASDAAGHSYAAMMEQAGRATAEAIAAHQNVHGQHVLVLVGPGNNGGDGLVAARYLAEAHAQVTCYLLKPRDPAHDQNYCQIRERGIDALLAEEDEDRSKLKRLVGKADIIVDAFLGTGTRLPLRGALAEILEVIGESIAARRQPLRQKLTSLTAPAMEETKGEAPFVVAVDGPTGMDYDSGALDETVIPADLTVTFAYPKVGHFRFPGAGALGELVIADIGTDPALAADVTLEVVTPEMVRGWLPPRPPGAHKGTFGKALIVAGSANYTGAAYLAGAATTRAGAGLVTLALPSAIHTAVAARLAEATYLPLPHKQGFIVADAAQIVAEQLASYDALLLGPGLGQEQGTHTFVEALLRVGENLPPPTIDADGLNILAEMEDWPRQLPPGSILTPHPGEMARLMGCSTKEVQADRVALARAQATAWEQVVVLKGAYTIVTGPDGKVAIEPFANPGLATAGTGDVLAGTIVALRAQGLGAFESAVAGAYLHGLAGELARQRIGTAGMVAGDVLAHLPQALQRIASA